MRMGVHFIIIVVLSLGVSVYASSEGSTEGESSSLFSGGLGDAIWTVLAFLILPLWAKASPGGRLPGVGSAIDPGSF